MKAWKGLEKPENLLEISESTALTFTSNHACRGMWTQASEGKNSVPDSKTVAMTGIGDAFVKRGSPVQVRSSALITNPVAAKLLGCSCFFNCFKTYKFERLLSLILSSAI